MNSTPLAPVDYLFTGNTACPVSFAFAYAEPLDPKQLQHSLGLLLEYLPSLGGRLGAQPDQSFVYEVPDRPRVLIEVARSDRSFAQLRDADMVRLVKSADGEAMMTVRLTQTPTGSVLAVSMSHALVDGFSFFLALSKWASCMRGVRIASPPTQRMLRPSAAGVTAALTGLSPRSVLEQSGMFWSGPRPEVRELPVGESLDMSTEAVAALIADTQRDVPTKLRQNDVLSAWLWRTHGTKWWAGQGNPDVYMSCPVDLRRLFGDDSRCLFGCTISVATMQASFDELMNLPLGVLALRIQNAVAGVFAAGFDKRVAPLEALRQRHGVQALNSVHVRHPKFGMLVTNMSRLPLAELDFGTGAPVSTKFLSEMHSMAVVLPAREGVKLSVYPPTAHA